MTSENYAALNQSGAYDDLLFTNQHFNYYLLRESISRQFIAQVSIAL